MLHALLISLLVQCPDGSPPPCSRPAAAAAAPSTNSVAVLQLRNLSRDSAFDYLSEGLASEIATTMARVPRLEVRSPGAVRSAQRGIEPDPAVMARRLNVRYVVEGDFQRGGDRIRISVRLVAAATGTQRWSESYTRPSADLLTVQEEIARAAATAIAGELLPQERTSLAVRPTRNPEAYDRLLRGNFQLARRTPASVMRAIDEYGNAARLDPFLVQAGARAALCYALFLDWGWSFPGVPRDSQLARGMRAADAALRVDSLSADAWMARGYLLSFQHPRTLEGVLESLERSTTLDPRNAEAWHQYGSWLFSLYRRIEALDANRRALAIEPGRAVSWLQEAQLQELLGRDREAVAAFDSSIAADPEFYASYAFSVWARLRLGDTLGARASADAAMRHSPPSERYYGFMALAEVAAHGGDTVTARRYMADAVAPLSDRPAGPLVTSALALGFISAGQPELAIDWLERTDKPGALLWGNLQFAPFRSLISNPRYVRLIERIRPPGAAL